MRTEILSRPIWAANRGIFMKIQHTYGLCLVQTSHDITALHMKDNVRFRLSQLAEEILMQHATRTHKYIFALFPVPVQECWSEYLGHAHSPKQVLSIAEVKKKGNLHDDQCTFPPVPDIPKTDYPENSYLACVNHALYT